VTVPAQTVDIRNYETAPGPMKTDWLYSLDAWRSQGEWIVATLDNTTHKAAIIDYLTRNATPPYLFGVRCTYDTGNGWRRFTNPGTQQPADYPPQATPLIMGLPVLSSMSEAAVQGTLIPEYANWRAFDVETNGHFQGRIWHKVYAFLLASYDFGGSLGKQTDVFVIQDAMTGNPAAGTQRIESYFYVQGWGRARESAYDPRVSPTVDATRWDLREPGEFQPATTCPVGNEANW
jgi:hypothetical protein